MLAACSPLCLASASPQTTACGFEQVRLHRTWRRAAMTCGSHASDASTNRVRRISSKSQPLLKQPGSAGKVEIQVRAPAPPPDFDFRALVASRTREYITQRHPELLPLVDEGALVVYERPESYRERRDDGYSEPQVVLLMGTAHVSERSAHDVGLLVQAVRPDAVVVELCRSRSAVMAEPEDHSSASTTSSNNSNNSQLAGHANGTDNDQVQQLSSSGSSMGSQRRSAGVMSLSGGGRDGLSGSLVGALGRSASLGGQSGLLLRLLLAQLASRTAGRLGVQGGGEFLAARRAAEAVDAQVVLGDRPIEITLQRAWDSLRPGQRLRLCASLAGAVLSGPPKELDAALVERLRSDDALSVMLNALGRAYPELLGPLVHERDAYLAWSLKRSKAVNGASTVVGVVGAGHLRGVVYALTADNGGDTLTFASLVDNKNKRSVKQAALAGSVGRLAFDTIMFGVLYWAWMLWSERSGL